MHTYFAWFTNNKSTSLQTAKETKDLGPVSQKKSYEPS